MNEPSSALPPDEPTRDLRSGTGGENPPDPGATLDRGSTNGDSFELATDSVPPRLHQIGPYKLLQRLGAGGMGEVWVAEQSEPVRRRVALKLIKGGVGSKEIIARFEAERQALALMNHPNIARILDAGTTPDGQPYFVMELVAGKPLTQYCDENKLSIDQRLKLFIDVCAGVQHAHQKGIIHRDLKPGNIIVGIQDGVPVPKIIDFGLAKAMESTQRLTDQSLFTGIGQILGTLKYMSPEQASLDNLDIDTRADIYALGVILYELLTGSTPLDDASIKGQAALKILEFIRDKEAVKPSSKLGSSTDEQVSSITGQRRTDSGRLKRILLGDLDWIVMKALEKDRTRRYESASGFAADLRRYLDSEPVVARPPSLNYRIRKFVRKNRVGVLAAALVLLTLIGGIIGTSLAMFRALAAENLAENRLAEANTAREEEARQRKLAEEQQTQAEKAKIIAEVNRKQAEQNLAFARKGNEILGSVFSNLDPEASYGNVAELRDALRQNLEQASRELEQAAIGDPMEVSALEMTLGRSLLGLGYAEPCIRMFSRALEKRTASLGGNHPDTLSSLNNLALGYRAASQFDQAAQLLEQALAAARSELGPEHPQTLQTMGNLGVVYRAMGNSSKAIPFLEKVLEAQRLEQGPDHPDTLTAMNNLAMSLFEAGKPDQALPLLEQATARKKSELGPDHPDTLVSMNNLAQVLDAAGQPEQSRELFQQTFDLRKSRLGVDHPQTLSSMTGLAVSLRDAGKLEPAIGLLEEALQLARKRFGGEHPDLLPIMHHLAIAYRSAGQTQLSLEMLGETLETKRKLLGGNHPSTLSTEGSLAIAYQAAGQTSEALALYRQNLERRIAVQGRDHPGTVAAMNNLAAACLNAGNVDEALPLLEECLERLRGTMGPVHPRTLTQVNNLAAAYHAANRAEKALGLLEPVLPEVRGKLGSGHPQTLGMLNNLAQIHKSLGAPGKALPLLEEVLREKLPGADQAGTAIARSNLAETLAAVGETAMALSQSREAAALIEQLDFPPATAGPVFSMTIAIHEKAGETDAADQWREKWKAHVRKQKGEESMEYASELNAHANSLIRRAAWPQAEALLRQASVVLEKLEPDGWNLPAVRSLLGAALLAQQRLAEAEPLLLAGYEGLKQRESSLPPQAADAIPKALDRLIELHTLLEKPDEVARFQELRKAYPPSQPLPADQ